MSVDANRGTPLFTSPAQAESPAIVLVGTSFRTARIGFRERVAERLRDGKPLGDRASCLQEVSILSTCNRTEIYSVSTRPEEAAASLLRQVESGSDEGFYVKSGPEAVRHIFRVAAGLDSLVVGEEQVLRQVRAAGIQARSRGDARSVLASLFDAAYSSGQRARDAYGGRSRARSVGEAALRFGLKRLGRKPSDVLIAGSGETAKLASLRLRGARVHLLSRRRDAGLLFPGAIRVPTRRLRSVAARCDLIITATKSTGYVLSKKDVPDDRKRVILDLGFPRNVDPALKSSRFIRLFDLDDLALSSVSRRDPAALTGVESAIGAEASRFCAWLTATRLNPTLASLYRWAESVRREEALAALRRLPDSERERKVVEVMSRRLVSRLMAPHAAFVKGTAKAGDQTERLKLLESIFGAEGAGQ